MSEFRYACTCGEFTKNEDSVCDTCKESRKVCISCGRIHYEQKKDLCVHCIGITCFICKQPISYQAVATKFGVAHKACEPVVNVTSKPVNIVMYCGGNSNNKPTMHLANIKELDGTDIKLYGESYIAVKGDLKYKFDHSLTLKLFLDGMNTPSDRGNVPCIVNSGFFRFKINPDRINNIMEVIGSLDTKEVRLSLLAKKMSKETSKLLTNAIKYSTKLIREYRSKDQAWREIVRSSRRTIDVDVAIPDPAVQPRVRYRQRSQSRHGFENMYTERAFRYVGGSSDE